MQPTIHLDPVNKYPALRSKLKKKKEKLKGNPLRKPRILFTTKKKVNDQFF
jgi:hypothetical protein